MQGGPLEGLKKIEMLAITVLLILLTLAGIAATSSLIKAFLMLPLCLVAIVYALAPAMGPTACVCVAGALISIVGFGLVAPWIICRRAPYDNNVCPLDAEKRKDLQRARIKWTVTLSLVSLAFTLKMFVKRAANHFMFFRRLLLLGIV